MTLINPGRFIPRRREEPYGAMMNSRIGEPSHSAVSTCLRTVFDRGREPVNIAPHPPCAFPGFRRTAADARAPRRVVTAVLMGDPGPGRSAQDDLDSVRADLRAGMGDHCGFAHRAGRGSPCP